MADLLIKSSADIEAQDSENSTPLHQAAIENSTVAILLIEHGADIEAQDADGNTPLHTAAQSNSIEVANLLIEHGADVEAQDADGNTPGDRAIESNSLAVTNLLLAKGAHIEPVNPTYVPEIGYDIDDRYQLDEVPEEEIALRDPDTWHLAPDGTQPGQLDWDSLDYEN
tara:strand:- start:9 stop:515 length:507 start_codon:yes stop_codon:yes gene_type:complete